MDKSQRYLASATQSPVAVNTPNNAPLRTVGQRLSHVLELLNELRIVIGSAHQDGSLDTSSYKGADEKLAAIARASRAAGLTTYCSISLHILEQLWPMSRGRYLSSQLSELIGIWTALSVRHLEKPASCPRSVALVAFLADRRWERPVGQAHRQLLLLGLRQDWSSSIEEFQMPVGHFAACGTRGVA